MTVLLVGATGKIGPHVARALVERDTPVRVLARNAGRAYEVLPPEVDVRPGRHEDLASAMDDVDAVLLLTEHGPEMARHQLGLLDQIADPRVRIVKISGTNAVIRPDGPDAGRQHWRVEQALIAKGNPWVVLRPNAFMQTLVSAAVAGAQTENRIVNPIGTAGISLIDGEDVGAVAAETLLSDRHEGQTYALTGTASYTYRDIGEAISAVRATPVTVIDAPPHQAAETVRARGGTQWEAEHLAEMLTLFATGAAEAVTGDVETVIGRRPRSLEEYLRDRAPEFAGSQR